MKRSGAVTASSSAAAEAGVAILRQGGNAVDAAVATALASCVLDVRWATPEVETIQRLAKQLVALQPDLIVTQNTPGTAAMLQQTRVIAGIGPRILSGRRRIAKIAKPTRSTQ
jgi:putative ABC transport system substrate-binding protein